MDNVGDAEWAEREGDARVLMSEAGVKLPKVSRYRIKVSRVQLWHVHCFGRTMPLI
jgi:hypothetical protein